MNRHLRAVEAADQDSGSGGALSAQQTRALRRAKRLARFIGLILPLFLTVVGAIIMLVWLPRMPDPAAIHWNGAGEPDGFDSPWVNLVVLTAVSLVLTALYFMQGVQSLQARMKQEAAPRWSSMNRLLPAIVLGTVTLNQVMAVGTSASQLDAVDARETGPILGVLIGSFVAGIAVAVLAFFAQPKLRIDAPSGEPQPALELGETERAVWIREVGLGRKNPIGWVTIATLVPLAALTAWTFTVDSVAGWITLACTLLVLVALATCLRFRVRIDSAGLEVRSVLGWPVFRVAADDVRSVTVAQIEPFAEYGGWGWRITPDRTGVVMRRGEGIVVTRRSGRIFGVTVDDAESGAAVLAAVTRARAAEGSAQPHGDEGENV
ncbi:DUF1648 domain-containing protein [Leucobacter tenebrionis]|uniref:DUF1648 domain-containing protein n=1 Tax=Leucobacter tenebrionis TaxID=2873270 RepID=UPI001CA6D0B0|nr:DUF1648 domain-containing protein [Leucobacter tenebrionis]QZY51454.1 DUF1648 domain-containing protein [Leucobacter tenebrionis]